MRRASALVPFVTAGDIVVERESQKGMVIGKGGSVLKEVGKRARAQMPEGVYLELRVKVAKDWRDDEAMLNQALRTIWENSAGNLDLIVVNGSQKRKISAFTSSLQRYDSEDAAFRQEFEVKGGDFAKAGEVSCEIKNLLKELGLSDQVVRRAAIASYEAEMNIIMYAWQGRLDLSVTPDRVRIVVEDRGPGIEDIELAMTEGYSTATPEMRELGFGAGMGLTNIKRNADDFAIRSEVGRGTRLEMTIMTNGHRT